MRLNKILLYLLLFLLQSQFILAAEIRNYNYNNLVKKLTKNETIWTYYHGFESQGVTFLGVYSVEKQSEILEQLDKYQEIYFMKDEDGKLLTSNKVKHISNIYMDGTLEYRLSFDGGDSLKMYLVFNDSATGAADKVIADNSIKIKEYAKTLAKKDNIL